MDISTRLNQGQENQSIVIESQRSEEAAHSPTVDTVLILVNVFIIFLHFGLNCLDPIRLFVNLYHSVHYVILPVIEQDSQVRHLMEHSFVILHYLLLSRWDCENICLLRDVVNIVETLSGISGQEVAQDCENRL